MGNAAEIQKPLQQFEQANPSATEAEKKTYVTASVPPTLKARTVSALKAVLGSVYPAFCTIFEVFFRVFGCGLCLLHLTF